LYNDLPSYFKVFNLLKEIICRRRETKSEKVIIGYFKIDPKPGDLFMGRLNLV